MPFRLCEPAVFVSAVELDDKELIVEIARSKGKRTGGRRIFRGRARGRSARGRGGSRRGRPQRYENSTRSRDRDVNRDPQYQDNNGWDPEYYADA